MTREVIDFGLLIVDGDNLLHRVLGGRTDGGLAWLIPRLRAALPAGARSVVMLDGGAGMGQPMRQRAAPGVEVHHSGKLDGDTAILGLLGQRPFFERARTVVVTDDRALADRVRHSGGISRRLDWFLERLDGPASISGHGSSARRGSIGGGRAPAGPTQPDQALGSGRPAWRPGRGATRKIGNPRRRSTRMR